MLQRSQDVFCFLFRVAASVKSKMKHSNGLSSKIFKKGITKTRELKIACFTTMENYRRTFLGGIVLPHSKLFWSAILISGLKDLVQNIHYFFVG